MARSQPARDMDWKEALRKCRVEIVQTIYVNDIIDTLIEKNVLKADRAKLIQTPIDKKTRSEQIEIILNHLARRPEEEIEVFVDSLKEEYMPVHQTLVEAKEPGTGTWRDVLKKKRVVIVRDVDIRGHVINTLISASVISENNAEGITNFQDLPTEQGRAGKLLDLLGRKTVEDFKIFLTSLETSYKTLKKRLEEALTKEQGSDGWKNVLRKQRVAIVQDLRVSDVLDYLISKEVLDEDKKEEVCMPAAETRKRQAEDLLDYLSRRTEKDFRIFLEAVKDVYNQIYKDIETVLGSGFFGENASVIAQPEQDDPGTLLASVVSGVGNMSIGPLAYQPQAQSTEDDNDHDIIDGGDSCSQDKGMTHAKLPDLLADTKKGPLNMV